MMPMGPKFARTFLASRLQVNEVRSYNPPYYKIKYEDDDEEELDAAKDETDLIVCHVQCFSRLNFQ